MRARIFLILFCAALTTTSPLAGATYTIGFGGLTATGIFSPAGGLSLDVRGLTQIDAHDGAVLLGQFLMSDTTFGTDPGFATLPFGNNGLIDMGPGGPSTGPFATTLFDFTAPVLNGNSLFLRAQTTLPTASDPGLNTLFADNPMVFLFGLTGTAQLPDGSLEAQWILTDLGTSNPSTTTTGAPEPGSLSLIALGLVAGYRRFSISHRH
jgi:hypothetical protein